MMRNTHIAMGVASAVAITNPSNISECLVAVMGGAIGGVIGDIDIMDSDYKNDDFFEKFIGIKIAGMILFLDFLLQAGICEYIINRNRTLVIAGGIAFCILCVVGIRSAHRTFTHSLLGLFLFSAALSFLYPPVVISFAIGFVSHIVLDLLNKKKVRILYPSKYKTCLGLCYANKKLNTILMYVGTISSALLILKCLLSYYKII